MFSPTGAGGGGGWATSIHSDCMCVRKCVCIEGGVLGGLHKDVFCCSRGRGMGVKYESGQAESSSQNTHTDVDARDD